jgi:NAD(P)-dependent dehydrogenase (short-subunit alcohol dehydrogenase family)
MATIVMTGGTAGLGRLAARRLLRSPNTRLLLGARSSAPRGAEALALEMTKLDNVRCFASAVGDRLGTTDIDALVLNAGMSPPDGNGRTPDGFEVAFAVNHLAHYLLLRLLLPRLAHGATVVLTTSGTHDPAEGR